MLEASDGKTRRRARYDAHMADLNRLAHRLVQETTEPGEEPSKAQRNGHVGGVKGGRARAEALTPERRSEIARKAAAARWRKPSPSS